MKKNLKLAPKLSRQHYSLSVLRDTKLTLITSLVVRHVNLSKDCKISMQQYLNWLDCNTLNFCQICNFNFMCLVREITSPPSSDCMHFPVNIWVYIRKKKRWREHKETEICGLNLHTFSSMVIKFPPLSSELLLWVSM